MLICVHAVSLQKRRRELEDQDEARTAKRRAKRQKEKVWWMLHVGCVSGQSVLWKCRVAMKHGDQPHKMTLFHRLRSWPSVGLRQQRQAASQRQAGRTRKRRSRTQTLHRQLHLTERDKDAYCGFVSGLNAEMLVAVAMVKSIVYVHVHLKHPRVRCASVPAGLRTAAGLRSCRDASADNLSSLPASRSRASLAQA